VTGKTPLARQAWRLAVTNGFFAAERFQPGGPAPNGGAIDATPCAS
jgi:hypothetical protein